MSLIAFVVKFEQMSLAIPGSRNSIIDFKNTLALDEFKSKQKSVWINMFWKFIHYTIYWNKTQML